METSYEEMARAVEGAVGPLDTHPEGVAPMDEPKAALAAHEVQTSGPVIIDTTTGTIREAETGHVLVQPVAEEDEREFDISLAGYALIAAAAVLAVVAVAVSPLTPSQKFALVALDLIVFGERVLWEIRRSGPPTAPEGVIYGSTAEDGLAGYDDGPAARF
jgi:hypothetical protein